MLCAKKNPIANVSGGAPYIKAAARDIKAYRDSKGYRKIPVGYSAAGKVPLLDLHYSDD